MQRSPQTTSMHLNGDIVSANWGSVPDWFAAGGTLVAVAALSVASKDYRSRSNELRDNEVSQARLVTVNRDEANQYVKVINRSSLPIFDVEIEELTLRAEPTARWRPSSTAWDAESTAEVVAPDGEFEVPVEFIKTDGVRFDVRREMIHQLDVASELDISFDAQIKFTDTAGRRWRRLNGNKPTRVFT